MKADLDGLMLTQFTGNARARLFDRSTDFPSFMTPASSEYNEDVYNSHDSRLTLARWWGHTGGRPGHGAVVSLSNVSCADPSADCGAEPGDDPTELICKVITAPANCGYEKYRTYDGSTPCPFEVNCGGQVGSYVRVRLPGEGRILALRSVDVFRSKPVGENVKDHTSAEESKRGYACYGVEAPAAPSASSENFLEEVKKLDYQVSTDPTDPIFYSTCMMYRIVYDWLPIKDDAAEAAGTQRQWNYRWLLPRL